MRRNLLYATLLLAAGACQRVDVQPASSQAAAPSRQSQSDAKQNINCGSPTQVLPYIARWGYANSPDYIYQRFTYQIKSTSGGGYQPLQMRVKWDAALCNAQQATFLKVFLHQPGGVISEMGTFNPSAGQTSAVITIPPVVSSTDLYSVYDDAAPGDYYVHIEYGISGSSAMDAYGNYSNAQATMTCVKEVYE